MRSTLFNAKAAKQTVSLTVNSDLYAKAKQVGINASRVAEEALTLSLACKLAGQIKTEIKQDLESYNAYVAKHGSPAELARSFYSRGQD